jgi:hypothetical protein
MTKIDNKRAIQIYAARIRGGEALTPYEQFDYGGELFAGAYYKKAAAVFRKLLRGGQSSVSHSLEACALLSRCYTAHGETKKALAALLYSFAFDAPRPEICSMLAAHFSGAGQTELAAFWSQAPDSWSARP